MTQSVTSAGTVYEKNPEWAQVAPSGAQPPTRVTSMDGNGRALAGDLSDPYPQLGLLLPVSLSASRRFFGHSPRGGGWWVGGWVGGNSLAPNASGDVAKLFNHFKKNKKPKKYSIQTQRMIESIFIC